MTIMILPEKVRSVEDGGTPMRHKKTAMLLKPLHNHFFISYLDSCNQFYSYKRIVCGSKSGCKSVRKGVKTMGQSADDIQLTPDQREHLDTKLALALFEQMYSEGKINEKTIQKLRKNAEKRLDRLKIKC